MHLLAVASLTALFSSLVFRATVNPVWDPQDEIAHFDYVVALSKGGAPRVDDLISPFTFEITRELSRPSPGDHSPTRRSMGLAGRSYEAQQPPLYYASLLPAYASMKALAVEPTMLIIGLRIVSLTLVAAGCLVLIELYRRLGRIWDISSAVGWLCAVIAMSLFGPHALSIGNDAGSFFCGSLVVLMSARYLTSWRQSWLVAASLFVVAGAWVKVINVGLAAVPVACFIWGWRRREVSAKALAGILPLALAPAWEVYNWVRHHMTVPSWTVAGKFAGFVDPLSSWTDVVRSLVVSLAMELGQSACATEGLAAIAWLTMLANVVICLVLWRRESARPCLPALLGGGGVLLTIGAALFLNETVRGVHWHAFRHYMGFGAFWVIAMAGFPVRSRSHGEATVLWAAVVIAVVAAGWNFFGPMAGTAWRL